MWPQDLFAKVLISCSSKTTCMRYRLFAERAERSAAVERRNVLEQQVQEANAACRACMSIEL